ncbi:hypothetical protein EDC96DRAFT_538486 [Choanephora cucurbitarum]|nr:hypothetical protein EDC96DRAFT_538486 [Choanephora cucurbitarum]
MPAFKCSGCQSLFASRAQLRTHQRETGCFRTVIENALAASTVVRDLSVSPVLDQMERSSRPVIDRHEGTTEAIVEQDDVPDFEGISPVASVTSNDPMDIEEVDQVVDAQVDEEPVDTEVFKEEDLVERGPIVQQWVEDAQLDECDDLAMKLMRVFDTNKISRQGQRNIFKCLNVEFRLKLDPIVSLLYSIV